ncbi:MAG TPA: SMP-30/gluconolactonase/LRE family protein [Rhodanobacteraceae bacterium]|nr:SMP-30/gluconolactonase/LRE family protein [Rhodanobacteraceae bacterium]
MNDWARPPFVVWDYVDGGVFTKFIEGSSVGPDGALYLVGFGDQRNVARIPVPAAGRAALPEVFVELPPGSAGNGTRIDRRGNLFVADYTAHNVWRVDLRSRRFVLHAHLEGAFQPNDLALAPDGTLYASDPDWATGNGQVWRIRADGSNERVAVGMGTTNGIAVNPVGDRLYVDESVQRKIVAFDIRPGGDIVNQRTLVTFDDGGMDGMRCDVHGNLYVTRYDAGAVAIVAPDGRVLRTVPLAGRRPTNLDFGGVDGRTVYVTLQDRGAVEAFRSEHPGHRFGPR